MAAVSNVGANESGLEDLTICPICYETYDDVLKIPKFLPCHHTFCLRCLQEMATHVRRLTCPLCRQLSYKGLDELATNNAFLRFARHHQRRDKLKWCSSCRQMPARSCFSRSHHHIFEVDDISHATEPFIQVHELSHQIRKKVVADRREISRRLKVAEEFFLSVASKFTQSIQFNETNIESLTRGWPNQVNVPLGNIEEPLQRCRKSLEECMQEQEDVKKILNELKALEFCCSSTPLPSGSSGHNLENFKREFGTIFTIVNHEMGEVLWPSQLLDVLLKPGRGSLTGDSLRLFDSHVSSSSTIQRPRKRMRSISPVNYPGPSSARVLYGEMLHGVPSFDISDSRTIMNAPAEEILCCREDERDRAQVLDCAWNPHQDILACSTTIGTVQLITCHSSRFGSSFQTHSVQFDHCPMFCLDWDESGKCLAIGSDSGVVYLWSGASDAPLLLEGHDNCVKSVKWNRFGAPKLLISSSTNGVTVIWDTTANAILQRLTFSSGRIASIHWLQRSHFIGILPEGLVVFWRVSEEKASKEIRFFLRKDHVHVALQRHSSPSSDGILQLISSVVETGNPGIRRVKNPFCSVDVCLSDTKASISSGIVARAHLQSVQLWKMDTGTLLRTLRTPSDIQSVSFSPDGTKLAAASTSTIYVWSTSNWEEIVASAFNSRYVIGHFAWNSRNDRIAACLGQETIDESHPFVHIVQV